MIGLYGCNSPCMTPAPTDSPTPSPTSDVACDDLQEIVPDPRYQSDEFELEFNIDEFNTEIMINITLPMGSPTVVSITYQRVDIPGAPQTILVMDPTNIKLPGLVTGVYSLTITFAAPPEEAFTVYVDCLTPSPTDSPIPAPTDSPTPAPTDSPTKCTNKNNTCYVFNI